MESCGNSNLSKLLLLSLLPSRMKKIHPKLKALEWSHHFFHYKSMGIFPGAQGQETPKSLVRSCPISSPSDILWLFFFFFFFFTFYPITFFSTSSDIQGVQEGHPPACLTNYKYGILMFLCSHLSFIYHAFLKQ